MDKTAPVPINDILVDLDKLGMREEEVSESIGNQGLVKE